MRILIFDMDGVLIEPHGYHRALKETVRLAGIATKGVLMSTKDKPFTILSRITFHNQYS